MDEGLDLFLQDVGVVAVVAFVRLDLDHLLLVVRSDHPSVKGNDGEDGGQAGPHDEGVQVAPVLSSQAILNKLAESQFLDVVDRQQMIVSHWIVEDVELIMHAV